MKALARAVINAAAYWELADEAQADPELALQALEEIAYNLSYCTDEEKRAIVEVLADMRAAELASGGREPPESGPRPEMLEFLDNFLISFGLADEEEGDEPEAPPRLNLL